MVISIKLIVIHSLITNLDVGMFKPHLSVYFGHFSQVFDLTGGFHGNITESEQIASTNTAFLIVFLFSLSDSPPGERAHSNRKVSNL